MTFDKVIHGNFLFKKIRKFGQHKRDLPTSKFFPNFFLKKELDGKRPIAWALGLYLAVFY